VKPLSRAVGAPIALIVGALVLVSCGNSSSSPGAAALVGKHRISTESLQRTVDRALKDPQAKAKLGANRAAFVRDELGRLINNDVIAAAAAAHGVTVNNNEIDAQISQFAQQAGGQAQLEQSAVQNGVPKEDLREFIRFYVLQQKLADKLVADVPVTQDQLQAAYQQNIDQFDQVHSAHILVKDKKTADKILAQVKQNPGDFAKLAAQYSQDTSNKNSGGDLGSPAMVSSSRSSATPSSPPSRVRSSRCTRSSAGTSSTSSPASRSRWRRPRRS